MSIADFTAALKSRANAQLTANAKQSLDLLVKGSFSLFNSKDPLSIRSGASLLSKGKIIVASNTKDRSKSPFKEENLTEVFRSAGELQGRTALIITGADIERIFKDIPVIPISNKPSLVLYVEYLLAAYGDKYKAKHFEFYVGDGNTESTMVSTQVLGQKKLADVFSKNSNIIDSSKLTAIRGLNFSHANSLTHMASFLVYCQTGSLPGKENAALVKQMENEISSKFHRGHILAQTTGRAMLSTKLLYEDTNLNKDNPILQMVELSKQLDIESSGLKGIHSAILAQVEKDFSSTRGIRMNIAFQPITSSDGTGNSDTGRLSTSIALVTTLQALMDKLVLTQTVTQRNSKSGKVSIANSPAAKSIDNYVKVLEGFLEKLSKDNDKLYNALGKLLDGTKQGSFVNNLRTSKSINDFISDNVANILSTGKSTKDVKTKTPNISAISSNTGKPNLPKLNNSVKNLVTSINNIKKATSRAIKAREVVKRTLPTATNLLSILQAAINQQVAQNMGKGSEHRILNYRTGRFAESVKVERLSESRQGMISAFYSYMRNPYGTFSEGGRQESPKTRDPKLLISKSIREIAAPIVGARMRAILI